MRRIGVRELRQNASAVLRRVVAGESVEVIQRGQPVPLIVPLPESTDVIERLIAEEQGSRALIRSPRNVETHASSEPA